MAGPIPPNIPYFKNVEIYDHARNIKIRRFIAEVMGDKILYTR